MALQAKNKCKFIGTLPKARTILTEKFIKSKCLFSGKKKCMYSNSIFLTDNA